MSFVINCSYCGKAITTLDLKGKKNNLFIGKCSHCNKDQLIDLPRESIDELNTRFEDLLIPDSVENGLLPLIERLQYRMRTDSLIITPIAIVNLMGEFDLDFFVQTNSGKIIISEIIKMDFTSFYTPLLFHNQIQIFERTADAPLIIEMTQDALLIKLRFKNLSKKSKAE